MHNESLTPPTIELWQEIVPLDEAFERGSRHVQGGRLAEARELYRVILSAYPDHPRALHALGVVSFRLGAGEEGVELIRRAVSVKPDFAEAFNNLGNVLKELGRKQEGAEAYQSALNVRPDFADAAANLGQLLLELERPEEAVLFLQKCAELRPQSIEAHGNLGLAYHRLCLYDTALQTFDRVLAVSPDHAPTHHNIGVVHLMTGRWDAAVASFERSLAITPDDSTVLTVLGMTLTHLGRTDEALKRLRQALKVAPLDASALNALGNALLSRGEVAEAIESYRTACTEHPDYLSAASNLLFALNYSDKVSQREIFEQSVRHAALLPPPGSDLPAPPQVIHDPQRPLRIAYLSSDLRQHPVSYFLAPLLAHHDRSRFEVACYANVTTPDQVTARLRGMADRWVDVTGLDPAALALRIWEDRVDVLVELNGHTGGSLLPALARRPAPVQVTWLGYPNTTGLAAIDYRLTDALTDPPGESDLLHSEELYRLPHGFLCYEPPTDAPPVAPAPLLENGFVTFGSFNNLAKVTPQVIELWARLLLELPGSRLLLKNRPLTDPGTVERFLAQFESHGVSRERITTLPYVNGVGSHLAVYGSIDIALDPFPYNGTTTTCDALWMGVPVVTLEGDRHGARVGTGLLARVGLEKLSAASHEEYLARALELAGSPERLCALRSSLRERMANSDLCNAEQFTRDVEQALRLFWERWCANERGEGEAVSEPVLPRGGAVAIPPELAPSLASLADRYRESGRKEKALESYRQALQAAPGLYQAQRGLGLLLAMSGRREEGAEHLVLASRCEGCDAAAKNQLGEMLAELGYPQQARDCYLGSLALDPSLAVAHFNLANALALDGDTEEACKGYLQALACAPSLALAHNNLGNLHCQGGRYQDAEASYLRGLALEPELPLLHNNIGGLWQKLGRLEEALVSLRRGVELDPGYAEAWTNLGMVLADLGKYDEALAAQQKALELKPDLASAHNNLGNLLVDMGEPAQGVQSYSAAIVLAPDSADFHANLGNALTLLGRPVEALESCGRALQLLPGSPLALNNMGNALMALGRSEEALESYQASLRAQPVNPEALHNTSMALKEQSRLEQAEEYARRAIELKREYPAAWCNLAHILISQVRIEETIETLKRALEVSPDDAEIRSNLLFLMNYSPSHTVADICREAKLLAPSFPAPRQVPYRQPELRTPRRRLRIGYVSGDLGRHPVGYFMAPVLPAHDRSQVEVFCYSSRLEDDLTITLKSHTDVWRSTVGMSDATLERTIREDGIDILIDLSGHTSGNRLPVFAQKPAPVQVTWAGYVGTTGLPAIDYLISDWRETPEGSDEHHVEQIVRLPDGYVCYAPPHYAPAVGPLPLERNGYLTFGCFNNLNKINAEVTALWGRLLQRIPDAKLLLVTKELGAPVNRRRFEEAFAAHGVAERVELSGKLPHAELLGRYGEVDIALDPFPYSGGLTTLESLWMGVPVITLGGDRFASRHSLSHLTTVGLPELVADGQQAYLELAEKLGRDPLRLARLRAGLRPRMAASPLCDGRRFARNLEAAYRFMWRRWCGVEHD